MQSKNREATLHQRGARDHVIWLDERSIKGQFILLIARSAQGMKHLLHNRMSREREDEHNTHSGVFVPLLTEHIEAVMQVRKPCVKV